MKRALCLLLAFAMVLPSFTLFASATEVPLVLEEPAVLPAETAAEITDETTLPAATDVPPPADTAAEPVIIIPEAAEEPTAPVENDLTENPESAPYVRPVPETVTTTETIQVVKEIEPGVYTTEEQTVTKTFQLPWESVLPQKQDDGIMSAAITENGIWINFETFEDLKTLASRTYSERTYANLMPYDGTLVITEDITIPENLVLNLGSTHSLTVAKGATLRYEHEGQGLTVKTLTVNGTAYIGGYISIYGGLSVSGKLYSSGSIGMQPDATLSGYNNIVFSESYHDISFYKDIATMAELTEYAALAKENLNTRLNYQMNLQGDFVISSSVTLHENLELSTYNTDSLTINKGCTLTIAANNWFSPDCPVTVKGTLKNQGSISLHPSEYSNCSLTFTSTGSYSGNGRLTVYNTEDLSTILIGLNLDEFETQHHVYDSYFYYELRSVAGLTKLSTPTDLKWNTTYESVYNSATGSYDWEAKTLKGGISFKPGSVSQGQFDFKYYKDDGTFTSSGIRYSSGANLPEYISHERFAIENPESGTYYFTVQNTGDYVTHFSSDIAKSAKWTYTKPSVKLGKCTNPTWNSDQIKFTKPTAGAAYIGGYEVEYYYSATKNGTPTLLSSTWSYDHSSFQLGDWVLERGGKGYYYFKIRALSSDITVRCNGDWSAMSPALYYIGRPTLTTGNTDAGIPKLTWTAVEGATSYKLYRAATWDGTYTLLKTGTARTYTDTSIPMGQGFYYKVSAVVDGTETLCSAIGYAWRSIPVAKVTLSSNLTTGKNIIKWKAVTGAVSYTVYASSTEMGGYKALKTVTGLTHTHTAGVAGTRYYYIVVANAAVDGASSESAPVSRVCDLARPTGLKVTNVAASGKNKISWNKVAGASKYQVWYSTTGKDGSFKLLYTTKNLSHTHNNGVAGKMYYYKVKAVHANTNANSALTGSYKRTVDLAHPVVTAGNNTVTGKARLTWKAITGAAKYQVWFSETGKTGSFKCVWTTKNLYFNHNASKVGVIGYYKVMAIHTNTAANSAYSTVVTRAAK